MRRYWLMLVAANAELRGASQLAGAASLLTDVLGVGHYNERI